jgi:hypothetical protein
MKTKNIDMKEIVDELTQDWISCFSDPNNRNGFAWCMAKRGILPEGVDPNNEDVKRLLELD